MKRLAFYCLCVGLAATAADRSEYRETVQKLRDAREAKLKVDDGWLTVAGLFWLKSGANSFGSAVDCAIALPRVPAQLGVFRLTGGAVTLEPVQGAPLQVNGKLAARGLLKTDKSGQPDLVSSGRLTMFVIQRGPRFGIRLRDLDSQFRREFTHLNWFDIDPAYQVTGTFQPYTEKRHIKIDTVIGIPDDMVAPGKVTFTVKGQTVSLEPVEDEGKLWFIFRDATSGRTTYGGGRFLYSELPQNGKVKLDFNQAYNPPCVFTPYATCPLPPPQNRLTIPIEAGEKRYGKH